MPKIAVCACAENAETFSPPPRVSDPDMHHGTCVTHVPWCMSGSLTSGFLCGRWREKRSRHSRRMRNPQFYVSGKRPMGLHLCKIRFLPLWTTPFDEKKWQKITDSQRSLKECMFSLLVSTVTITFLALPCAGILEDTMTTKCKTGISIWDRPLRD